MVQLLSISVGCLTHKLQGPALHNGMHYAWLTYLPAMNLRLLLALAGLKWSSDSGDVDNTNTAASVDVIGVASNDAFAAGKFNAAIAKQDLDQKAVSVAKLYNRGE